MQLQTTPWFCGLPTKGLFLGHIASAVGPIVFYIPISWPRLSDTLPSYATPCPKLGLFVGNWGREQAELHISSNASIQRCHLRPLFFFYPPEQIIWPCSVSKGWGSVILLHIWKKRRAWILVNSCYFCHTRKLSANPHLTYINALYWKDGLHSTAFSLFNNKVLLFYRWRCFQQLSLFKCLCVCFLNK